MSKKLLAAFTLAAATALPVAAQTPLANLQKDLELPAFSLGDEQACGYRDNGDTFVINVPEGSLALKTATSEYGGAFQIPAACATELAKQFSGSAATYVIFDLNGPAEANDSIPVFAKDDGLDATFMLVTPEILGADKLKQAQVIRIADAGGFALKVK